MQNLGDISTERLIAHIVESHHGYLRRTLPRLHEQIRTVARVHGNDAPWLLVLYEVFTDLKATLLDHIAEEEEIIFPFVVRIEGRHLTPVPCNLHTDPFSLMEHDHQEAGAALEAIRRLTENYQVPSWAGTDLETVIEGLEQLNADVEAHVHKETHILFPRIHPDVV